ncbi:hypothetical protein N7505_011472 [Penicillium chrysogenum]|jgi:hypothetical protein|uniref:Uncharacterized protein n=1 Tax=Penicillium chrysogenum TaxID=5076 RepID=A0ABQ8W7X4_PENCH|nr:hypothetical protein N7505_011472 [Penicillium chrysogenum]
MSVPDWSKARIVGDGCARASISADPNYVQKFHLLSQYSDDTDSLTSSKCKDPFELPVLSPDSPVNQGYQVIVSRWVHEELETMYMIKHDPIHHERRYTVWFGINLDRFGPIDTPSKFFQVLEKSLLSGHVLLLDTVPSSKPPGRRELWIPMYGYFGNWYGPEGKKWAVLAAKRRTRLLKKLWERGDVRLVNEKPAEEYCPVFLSELSLTVGTGQKFSPYEERDWGVIFPELRNKELQLLHPEKEEKDGHCVLA